MSKQKDKKKIENIKLLYGTVIQGAVWLADSTLRVGVDVSEDEAASLLKDGLAAPSQPPPNSESANLGEEKTPPPAPPHPSTAGFDTPSATQPSAQDEEAEE